MTKAQKSRALVGPSIDSNKNENDTPTLKELYYMLREQIQHEDNLVNQRITWLLAIEGFLLAGFAGFLTAGDKFVADQRVYYGVLAVIIVVGVLFCLISKQGIDAAFSSLEILRNIWNEPPPAKEISLVAEWKSKEDARKKYPPITYVGEKSTNVFFATIGIKSKNAWFAAHGIPNLIILAWISFLVILLYAKVPLNWNLQLVSPTQPVISTPTAAFLNPTQVLTPTLVITQTVKP